MFSLTEYPFCFIMNFKQWLFFRAKPVAINENSSWMSGLNLCFFHRFETKIFKVILDDISKRVTDIFDSKQLPEM
jgi:hypothetical protein